METLNKQASYKILKKRQSTYIKAYAVLCAILLLTMGFYTYKNWVEYSWINEGINTNEAYISLLKTKVIEETSEYERKKPAFDEIDAEVSSRLANIFPEADEYTDLTKQLDAFEESINRTLDPFEVSSMDFQQPEAYDKYSILPLNMSIVSSAENFTKFLHKIENSGSLSEPIRLLDISSIRLSFRDSESSGRKLITFSVRLNAYFQK